MLYIFSVLVLITSNSAWAQLDEFKQSWLETGYDLEELYSEADFNPESCLSRQRSFTGCLFTLESMLNAIKGNERSIEFDGVNTLSIQEVAPLPPSKSWEEYYERENKKRENFILAFQMKTFGNLDNLFSQVRELVENHVPPNEHPYVAGTAYGHFLREAYDPRTTFQPKAEVLPKPKKYFGIGATVKKNQSDNSEWDGALTLSPEKGSPAERAGIIKGDMVLSVDGVDVTEMNINDIIDRIKGPESTDVTLTINRVCDQSIEDVVVTRGQIVNFPDWRKDSRFISLNKVSAIDDVCQPQKQPQYGEPQALYVPLTSFLAGNGRKLCQEFINLQIKDLMNPNSKGMIIDLRGNGGGSLNEVTCMLNSIISDHGGTIVGRVPVNKGEISNVIPPSPYFIFNTFGPLQSPTAGNVHYNKPVVVLIDGGSASASEIFAGTIQDMKRGWVIGQRSVGKGSVQTRRKYPRSKSLPEFQPIAIAETTAIYTLNSGRSPQQQGIIPDFHYDSLGNKIDNNEEFITLESRAFGSIQYEQNPWTQNRSEEVSQMTSCMFQENSHSDQYLKNKAVDDRLQRPFISDFPMDLAKDALECTPTRPVAL